MSEQNKLTPEYLKWAKSGPCLCEACGNCEELIPKLLSHIVVVEAERDSVTKEFNALKLEHEDAFAEWKHECSQVDSLKSELKESKSKNYKDQLDNCSRQCANLKSELETLKSGLKPEWIVNELAELGVKVGNRKFFLYKGRSLENSGTKYRLVGKREFGECCHPWHMIQRISGEERLPEDYSQFYKEEGEDKLWKPMKE